MARVIVLDAGPLGVGSKAIGRPDGDRCRAWIYSLKANGARVIVPEIADYEVRRELLRVNIWSAITRLDQFESVLEFDPITSPAMRRAAAFWATVRQGGRPTADPKELDADCILAAQATLLVDPGDVVTIATSNPGHLARFPGVLAELWTNIAP